MPKWEYGEIGKHAGFKILCRKASRFKSEYSHHLLRPSIHLLLDNLKIGLKAGAGDVITIKFILGHINMAVLYRWFLKTV